MESLERVWAGSGERDYCVIVQNFYTVDFFSSGPWFSPIWEFST